ncbi:MAG: hypothetical protein SVX43_16625 [Cyanobacteriota bacterium]|nr:hypothetical protein [Cyanobacteriota bacterium]
MSQLVSNFVRAVNSRFKIEIEEMDIDLEVEASARSTRTGLPF